MRYDTPVYFQSKTPGGYNSSTGDYEDDAIVETMRYASVMSAETETLRLLYGEIRQGILTVHIQLKYKDAFDHIRIGDRVYAVDHSQELRTKQVFIVSEVP